MQVAARLIYSTKVVVLVALLTLGPSGCVSTYDANDPDVKAYLGVQYKTTLPQQFKYILYSKQGTLDASFQFTNSGTLVFDEDSLHYANNSDEVSVDYDDIVDLRRLTVPAGRPTNPLRRDTWLVIYYKVGEKTKKIGFRGDLARAHPWTGDRIYAVLRDTVAARKS